METVTSTEGPETAAATPCVALPSFGPAPVPKPCPGPLFDGIQTIALCWPNGKVIENTTRTINDEAEADEVGVAVVSDETV